MRICLVDDDSTQLDYLKILIGQWANRHHVQVDINFYHSAEEMLFEHDQSYPYDLIILDIQMGRMNGIELAKIIRKIDSNVTLAFVSGMADYVFDGYKVEAIRYILKPVGQDKIDELLNYVHTQMTKKNSYLIISVAGEKKRINYDDIIYFESMGHYITLHLENAEYDYKYNMSDLYSDLLNTEFIQTHRSYIVNMKYVEKITRKECQLIHNINIPLSRNAYKAVNEKFINYYREKSV